MPQHADLTRERWARFTPDQQILQVGAEMHRASASMARGDAPDEEAHRAAVRVLLQMRPEAARQIPYLLGPDARPMGHVDASPDPAPQRATSHGDS